MPIIRKNEAKPRVSKTPIIEPRTEQAAACSSPAEQAHDELSLIRAEIAAHSAGVDASSVPGCRTDPRDRG
jgi:hypothetical protein